ncbi:MAG: HepT-like ribonuclease domain-containing protein [Cyanobacteria bacterium J06581_3]
MTVQNTFELPTVLAKRLNVSARDIALFCQRWHITELGLFGSVIRNDFRADSDVDVLVVFDPDVQQDVFARGHAQAELAELFGRDVDLTEKALLKNPFSRAEILQTYRVVYPAENANFTSLLAADERTTDDVRNNAALLTMIDSMQALQEFTQDKTFENYISDRFLRRVVERELETVGEAANRLTSNFQAKHSDIDWRGVVGLRNAIIHQYDELDYEKIWEIATVRVPLPIEKIGPLLSPLPENENC